MKGWSWRSFALGVATCLVVIVIPGAIIVGVQLTKAAEQQRYTECLASFGYSQGDPNIDLDGLLIAAEACAN